MRVRVCDGWIKNARDVPMRSTCAVFVLMWYMLACTWDIHIRDHALCDVCAFMHVGVSMCVWECGRQSECESMCENMFLFVCGCKSAAVCKAECHRCMYNHILLFVCGGTSAAVCKAEGDRWCNHIQTILAMAATTLSASPSAKTTLMPNDFRTSTNTCVGLRACRRERERARENVC